MSSSQSVNITEIGQSIYGGQYAQIDLSDLEPKLTFENIHYNGDNNELKRIVGELFDGIYSNASNGINMKNTREFTLRIQRPAFLHSISFDINTTQVVSGSIDVGQWVWLNVYDLQKPYKRDVYTNGTVVFDFKNQGGIGFFMTEGFVSFAFTGITHIGEIRIVVQRAVDILSSDDADRLRYYHGSDTYSPFKIRDWTKNGTTWKGSFTQTFYNNDKEHLPMQYEITTVPTSVNLTNLMQDRIDNSDWFAPKEGACVPTNVTQLEIVPRYALRITTVDLVWNRFLSDDSSLRPNVTFEGFNGTMWSPLVRLSLQISKTHEVHQYNISRLFLKRSRS